MMIILVYCRLSLVGLMTEVWVLMSFYTEKVKIPGTFIMFNSGESSKFKPTYFADDIIYVFV